MKKVSMREVKWGATRRLDTDAAVTKKPAGKVETDLKVGKVGNDVGFDALNSKSSALKKLGVDADGLRQIAKSGKSTKTAQVGASLIGKLRRKIGRASVIALLAIATVVPSMAQAQSMVNLQPPPTAITLQAQAMTQREPLALDGLKAKDVDFVVTNAENLNHGEVTFSIKSKKAPQLAEALKNADEVLLLAPWGRAGDELGSTVKVTENDGRLELTAAAFGSALTQTDQAPMFLVKSSDPVQSFSVDFNKMDVNFNELYHSQSEKLLESHLDLQSRLVDDYMRFQRGEPTEHFNFGGDAANWERAIEDGQVRIQQSVKNLRTDWISTARRN